MRPACEEEKKNFRHGRKKVFFFLFYSIYMFIGVFFFLFNQSNFEINSQADWNKHWVKEKN